MTTAADWRALLGRLRRILKRPHDVEDLLQAAFLRLETHKSQQDIAHFEAYLIRTALNIDIDEKRKLANRVEFADIDDAVLSVSDSSPLQDEVFDTKQRLEYVNHALDHLPAKTREIFLMRRVDGMRYRDIAETHDISVSAVEKHIAKAALHIAQWMSNDK